MDLWPAPSAAGPIDAVVELPASKSLTNRVLLLAALADRPTRLVRPLRARDTELMADALRALGTEVAPAGRGPGGGTADEPGDTGGEPGVHTAGDPANGTAGNPRDSTAGQPGQGADWLVTPGPFCGGAGVDCGLAGTVMRFVPPVAALCDGEVRFDGDPAARRRPMGTLLGALRALGVRVSDEGRGRLPFVVVGQGRVAGGDVTLDASASSQFVSGLLLAGCRYDAGLTVRHDGPPLPSLPHVEMTLAVLRERGLDARRVGPAVWRVAAGRPAGGTVTLEPDLSNAAPFLAAALVIGGAVRVPGWPHTTTQPGDLLRELLSRMGAQVSLDADGLTVRGTRRVHGIDVDLAPAGELTPVVVALAALADSPSTLRGIGHLRGHETDRLAALATELGRLGGDVAETRDGLVVRPRPLRPAALATYGDHRMAQAAALLGLAVPGVLVEDVATTAKTLPDFVQRWTAMLGRPAAA